MTANIVALLQGGLEPDQGTQYYLVAAVVSLAAVAVFMYFEVRKAQKEKDEANARALKMSQEQAQQSESLLEKSFAFFSAFEKNILNKNDESRAELMKSIENLTTELRIYMTEARSRNEQRG